jgi:multiple sugar transport system ATP-binding protein
MTLGDRIVVMKDGRVQQVDTPLGIYQRPANTFVATFVGSPPMNLVRGRLTAGAFVSESHGLRLPLPSDALPPAMTDGQLLILGLRPEALLLRPRGQGNFTARVVEVEPLGSETLLTLDAAGVPLTVRIDGLVLVARGEDLEFTVPASGWHWFDGSTETRLG